MTEEPAYTGPVNTGVGGKVQRQAEEIANGIKFYI